MPDVMFRTELQKERKGNNSMDHACESVEQAENMTVFSS